MLLVLQTTVNNVLVQTNELVGEILILAIICFNIIILCMYMKIKNAIDVHD